MNKSWQNNSFGGFVYFNDSQNSDSETFLSFKETPSPQQNRYSGNSYSNNSPYFKYNSPNNRRYNRKSYFKGDNKNNFNNSSFCSPNTSVNSSWQNRSQSSTNTSGYLHPSFMENPWKELEDKRNLDFTQNPNNFIDLKGNLAGSHSESASED